MKHSKMLIVGAAAAGMLSVTSVSQAQEEGPWSVSANVTLASDYLFRGISQTDEKLAIQGGFDISHASGFYAGTWASNVNFGTESSTEQDIYLGYGVDITENFNLDLSFIYFDYEGDAEFDYQEYVVGMTIYDIGISFAYSDEYLGDGGPKFFYVAGDYSIPLGENLSLDLHAGYNDIDDEDLLGVDSYIDFSIGLSTELAGLGMALAYAGTDEDDELGDAAEPRLHFAISKEF